MAGWRSASQRAPDGGQRSGLVHGAGASGNQLLGRPCWAGSEVHESPPVRFRVPVTHWM